MTITIKYYEISATNVCFHIDYVSVYYNYFLWFAPIAKLPEGSNAISMEPEEHQEQLQAAVVEPEELPYQAAVELVAV